MSDAFDPKKFLAETEPGAFDPKKFLSETQPLAIEGAAQSEPSVGGGETYVNQATNSLPLGKQLVNALSAGVVGALRPGSGVKTTAKARKELEAQGVKEQEAPGLVGLYRQIRDERDARTAAGANQNPLASGLGRLTGIGLSLAAPLPKITVGSGALGRIGSSALTGGAYQAINSGADSQGDPTKGDVGQVLMDALGKKGLESAYSDAKAGKYGHAALDIMGSGAFGGALTGGALGGALEGGRAALSPLSGGVRNAAISSGRRVLTNGADSLSKNEPIAEDAVESAIREGAIRPLGNNAGTYERLQDLSGEAADHYRHIVSQLEAEGIQGPRAREIADQLMSRGATLETRTGANKAIPNAYMDEAANAEAIANQEGRLGLTQAEDVKRALQKQAKYGKFEETPLNEARRDIASVYRAATERAVDEGSAVGSPAAQNLASQFVPAKQRLGNLLTAEEAARRGFARGAQRSHLGPMEMAAGLAEMAHGSPALAVPASLGMKLLRGRLPSTVASYGLRLSDALAPTEVNDAGDLGRNAATLINAFQSPEAQRSQAIANALRMGATP